MVHSALAQAAHRHRISLAEWRKMGESGVFPPDVRLELLDGEVLEMPPIGVAHAACVTNLITWFAGRLPAEFRFTVQNPVQLGEFDEPQPDLCIFRPGPAIYRGRHPGPGEILLLVEVADRTLRYDREVKVPLYARHGIPETWLVDVNTRTITAYTGPGADGYAEKHDYSPGRRVPLGFAPPLQCAVSEILDQP